MRGAVRRNAERSEPARTDGPSRTWGHDVKLESEARELEATHGCDLRVDVERDACTVWSHWQRFDLFPQVTSGILRVLCVDERRSLWEAEIGGRQQVWEARIVSCIPPRRLVWRSSCGARHAGELELVPLTNRTTRLFLRLRYAPSGPLERLAAWSGLVDRQVLADLTRCKRWIEGTTPRSSPLAGALAVPRVRAPGRRALEVGVAA